jgi:hypothetical protein
MQISPMLHSSLLPRPAAEDESSHLLYFPSHALHSHALSEEKITLSKSNHHITSSLLSRSFDSQILQVLYTSFFSTPTLCIFFSESILFHTGQEENVSSLDDCQEFHHAWPIPTGLLIQVALCLNNNDRSNLLKRPDICAIRSHIPLQLFVVMRSLIKA